MWIVQSAVRRQHEILYVEFYIFVIWLSVSLEGRKVMRKLSLKPPERTAVLQAVWDEQGSMDLGPCGTSCSHTSVHCLCVSVLTAALTRCRWFLSPVLVCVWSPGSPVQRRGPVGRWSTLITSSLFCFDLLICGAAGNIKSLNLLPEDSIVYSFRIIKTGLRLDLVLSLFS